MAGCAKEPYRDSAVEESMATKDAPHTLDVFHIAFAPGSDETERTFSWQTRGMNKKAVVELSQLDEEGNVLSSETFEAAGEGSLRGFSSHKATITGPVWIEPPKADFPPPMLYVRDKDKEGGFDSSIRKFTIIPVITQTCSR